MAFSAARRARSPPGSVASAMTGVSNSISASGDKASTSPFRSSPHRPRTCGPTSLRRTGSFRPPARRAHHKLREMDASGVERTHVRAAGARAREMERVDQQAHVARTAVGNHALRIGNRLERAHGHELERNAHAGIVGRARVVAQQFGHARRIRLEASLRDQRRTDAACGFDVGEQVRQARLLRHVVAGDA